MSVERPQPPVTDVSRPFWDATRDNVLLLQWCEPCDAVVFYPREVCFRCLGDDLVWRPAGGDGVVHAVSVQHKPAGPAFADQVPYAVALVELAEGARFMTNVVGCPPEEVVVGMPVRVTWEPLDDGRNLPLFEPTGGHGRPGR